MPPANQKLHRLTDILVEEVSDVDRAANKRRFLVVKRDESGDDMRTKLVPDGRGGYKKVPVTKADEVAPENESDEEKAKKAKAKADAEKAFPPGGKAPPFGGKKPPAGGKPADDEEDDDEEKAKAKKVEARKAHLTSLTACIDALMGVGEALKKAVDEEGDLDDEELKAKTKKAIEELAKSLEPTEPGAMSKERKARFTKALGEVSSLLKEALAATDDEGEPKKKSFADPTEAGAAGTGVQTDPELLKVIADLTGALKKSHAEIEAIRKSIGGTSNARGPVEKKQGGDDEPWPMDMNRPITKANTPKEVSFYDED